MILSFRKAERTFWHRLRAHAWNSVLLQTVAMKSRRFRWWRIAGRIAGYEARKTRIRKPTSQSTWQSISRLTTRFFHRINPVSSSLLFGLLHLKTFPRLQAIALHQASNFHSIKSNCALFKLLVDLITFLYWLVKELCEQLLISISHICSTSERLN